MSNGFLAAAAMRAKVAGMATSALRIVSLSQAHTLMLTSLGASDALVALDTFSSQPGGIDLPRIDSFAPDAEAVRKLRPDAIIASFASQMGALDSVDGPKMLLLEAPQGPCCAEQIFSQLQQLAQLVDREAHATALTAAARTKLDALRELARPLADARFLLELDPEGFTASDDAYLGQLFSALGLINAADDLRERSGASAGAPYFCPSTDAVATARLDFYLIMHQGTRRALPAGCGSAVCLQGAVHYDRVAWSLALFDVIGQCVTQMLHAKGHPSAPADTIGADAGLAAASLRVEDLRFALALDGVDLLAPMSTVWYNDAIAHLAEHEPAARRLQPLPDFGRGDDNAGCLALLLANTRAIWRPFTLWLRADPSRLDLRHPFDTYLQCVVGRALDAALPRGCRRDVFWACEEGTPRMVAMQRAAACAGLAHLDPSTHLSIHPIFGAWLSLRAVVVVDLPGLGRAPPAPLESSLSQAEHDEAAVALQRAIARSSSNLQEELHGAAGAGGAADDGQESCDRGAPAWREWVALRDVVRLGRRCRFCEDQIEYHYTKDRGRLRVAVLRPEQ